MFNVTKTRDFETEMGMDVMDESADQIKRGTRPFNSVERSISMKACILLGCLTGNAAEDSQSK